MNFFATYWLVFGFSTAIFGIAFVLSLALSLRSFYKKAFKLNTPLSQIREPFVLSLVLGCFSILSGIIFLVGAVCKIIQLQ